LFVSQILKVRSSKTWLIGPYKFSEFVIILLCPSSLVGNSIMVMMNSSATWTLFFLHCETKNYPELLHMVQWL
jgi:hypothetical protein